MKLYFYENIFLKKKNKRIWRHSIKTKHETFSEKYIKHFREIRNTFFENKCFISKKIYP